MLSANVRSGLLSSLRGLDSDNFDQGIRSRFFEDLRYLLFTNLQELSVVEVNSILQIFQYGLIHSYVSKDEKVWAMDNSVYFSGNCYDEAWHKKFESGDYNKDILGALLVDISNHPTSRNLNFELRNIEVTLSCDVEFEDLPLFIEVSRSILLDILAGKGR